MKDRLLVEQRHNGHCALHSSCCNLFDRRCLCGLQSSIERETGQLTRQADALRREHDKLVQERGRMFKRLDKLQDDLRVGLTWPSLAGNRPAVLKRLQVKFRVGPRLPHRVQVGQAGKYPAMLGRLWKFCAGLSLMCQSSCRATS